MATLSERFWSKVDKSGDCWNWTASLKSTGYGQFQMGTNRRGRPIAASRVSWFLSTGEWPPEGMQVCHRCDNRKCVRPEHLFLGTNDDNIADKVAKGRQTRGPTAPGAKLTTDNVETIRRLYTHGGLRQTQIAGLFGIDQSHVSHIVRRAA